MTIYAYLSLAFGILGVAFGVRCYVELWRWAKQCQRAHIIISYKRRSVLNASLAEWLGWVNRLDKQDNGRPVYRNGHFAVSIIRRDKMAGAKTTTKTLKDSRRSNNEKVAA